MTDRSKLSDLKSYCGKERFAKFVTTLRGQCRADGRLLYWQEKLLRDFSEETEVRVAADLDGILDLFRQDSVAVPMQSHAGAVSFPSFEAVRHFSSRNQMASGGSHLTDFVVKIRSHTVAGTCLFQDKTFPHSRPEIVPSLLGSLSEGAMKFIYDQASCLTPVGGVDIELLEFADNATDLKPHKYAAAIYFVLGDLFMEHQANRQIHRKLIGVPI